MALTTAKVTVVSRNSGTGRTQEDIKGHDAAASQVQEDTRGPAGIRKCTPRRRFGIVRHQINDREIRSIYVNSL